MTCSFPDACGPVVADICSHNYSVCLKKPGYKKEANQQELQFLYSFVTIILKIKLFKYKICLPLFGIVKQLLLKALCHKQAFYHHRVMSKFQLEETKLDSYLQCIVIFFEWGQDRILENHLVPMPCLENIFDEDKIPIVIILKLG